jgi:hypothetical protein
MIHAVLRSVYEFMRMEMGPGCGLTEREEEADAEEQDLSVLAAEERAAEIGVEGWGFPCAVADSASIGAEVGGGPVAQRLHVGSEDVDVSVARLHLVG